MLADLDESRTRTLTQLPAFFLFAVALGGTAGLVYSAATSLVTKESEETGRAIGLYISGESLAGLSTPPIAAAVGTLLGWRAATALGIVSAIPVCLLSWRFIQSRPPAQPEISLTEHQIYGQIT